MDALGAATSSAAALLGLGHKIGSIEVGKDADLLLIDGDPLKCIDVLLDAEKRIAVMQGGRFVSGALATG